MGSTLPQIHLSCVIITTLIIIRESCGSVLPDNRTSRVARSPHYDYSSSSEELMGPMGRSYGVVDDYDDDEGWKRRMGIRTPFMPKIEDLTDVMQHYGSPRTRGFWDSITNAAQTFIGKLSSIKPLVDIGINLGEGGIKISKMIEEIVEQFEEQNGFLSATVYELEYQTQEQCNIVIFNMAHYHANTLTDILYQTTRDVRGTTYGIWLAQGGTFVNLHMNPFSGWPNMGVAGYYSVSPSNRIVTFRQRPSCRPMSEEELYP